MTNTAEDHLNAQISVIAEKFGRRCLGDALAIEALLEQAYDAQAGEEAMAEIGNLAHRMAGGASIFGFGELTDPAIKLEAAIDGQSAPEQIRQAAEDLVSAIRRAIDARLEAIKA